MWRYLVSVCLTYSSFKENVPLLVGLVLPIGVANLGLKVALVLLDEIPNTREVRVLHVCIEVDLYDAVRDSLTEIFDAASASTVEYQEDGLVLLGIGLLLNEGLVLL